MMKPIHVHVHTYDADFEENKHPRTASGEFGVGGAKKTPAMKLGGTFNNPKIDNKPLARMSYEELRAAKAHFASKPSPTPSEKFVLEQVNRRMRETM